MGAQTSRLGNQLANFGNSMAGNRPNAPQPVQSNTFTGVNPDAMAFQQPQATSGKGSIQPARQEIAPAIQPPQNVQGKGASGQAFTYSPTSGQPQMGRPNQYTNTVGQWDNASIQPSSQPRSGGKGKG
jgi:hypothetical protein